MSDPDVDRFDRLPATAAERQINERPTRDGVLEFWDERFGIGPRTFAGHTFWEKGRGSVWAVTESEPDPIAIETLGLRLLRTGGRHWKPTTNGVQRFGDDATRNVIELDREAAERFVRGEDQAIEWDGEWGYLIAATTVAGEPRSIGVGLYIDGILRSQVPKSRRIELP